MAHSAWFGKSDFSGDPLMSPGAPEFVVGPYSHEAVGGPRQASIRFTCQPEAVPHLYGLLGCPVRIYNSRGMEVWWGLVEEVEGGLDGILTRYSLRDVANKVRVDYVVEHGTDAGLKTTTGWVSDSTSIARYKTRELIIRKGQLPATAATQYATTRLATLKDPKGQEIGLGADGQGQIICRGYWGTLGLKHLARNSLAIASHTTIGGSAFEVFRHNSMWMTQSFTVASAKTARLIELYCRRPPGPARPPGSHSPALVARINSGSPNPSGAALASGSPLYETDVSDEMEWVAWLLTAGASLVAGTTYWVSIGHHSGTGGWNGEFRVDEGLGFAGGSFKIFEGNSFRARVPDADLAFAVYQQVDSMVLLANLCSVVGVDYFAGADVDAGATSGVDMLERLRPDQNAMDKALEVIKQGTTASRRVLVQVRPDRRVRVYAEPAPAAADWYRDSHQAVRDPQGQRYDLSRCPVGMWLKRSNPLAVSPIDGSRIVDFVESATYNPQSGIWQPAFTDQPDPLEFSVNRLLGVAV